MTDTTFLETPAYVPVASETLFGVLTTPRDGVSDTVVVLAAGGWPGTSTARNRPLVHVARAVAEQGLSAFDFDYRGVGESTGTSTFALEELLVDDVLGVVAWLRAAGFRHLLLAGICYGSRVALAAAAEVDDLLGVALVSLPPSDHGKRLGATVGHAAELGMSDLARRAMNRATLRGLAHPDLRRAYLRAARVKLSASLRRGGGTAHPGSLEPQRPTVAPAVSSALRDLVARRVPTLCLYSRSAPHFAQFQEGCTSELADVIQAGSGLIEVVAVDHDIEELTKLSAQRVLNTELCSWLVRRAHAPVMPSGGDPEQSLASHT
jgi:pimeloyl-ACP methyl ester carboxylesterase